MTTPDNNTWLTPPRLAKQLGVSCEKVLTWIRNGELRAINVAERLSGRPRWRISPAALEEFCKRRESSPPPTAGGGYRQRRRPVIRSPISEDDGRLAKNIPHEVRVKKMAVAMAARKSGQFTEWRPFVPKAIARYAERTGVTVDEDAVKALKAWWEELGWEAWTC